MTIATNTIETSPIHQGTITSRWRVNASTADGTGCESIKDSPGSGYELVVTRLLIAISGSVSVTIGMNEESSGVKRTLLGPLGGAAMVIDLDFGNDGVVLDPNAALTIDASGAATVWVYAEGMTRVVDSANLPSSSPSASVSGSPSSSASA
jgi:hypothetical protein